MLVWRCHVRGPELEDVVQGILLTVVLNIRAGKVRDHDRILGYVKTIAQLNAGNEIKAQIQERACIGAMKGDTLINFEAPDEPVWRANRRSILASALAKLDAEKRELLTRFYLREQSKQEICAAMNLTETQFRVTKSRAKAELGVIGQRIAGMNSRLGDRRAAKTSNGPKPLATLTVAAGA